MMRISSHIAGKIVGFLQDARQPLRPALPCQRHFPAALKAEKTRSVNSVSFSHFSFVPNSLGGEHRRRFGTADQPDQKNEARNSNHCFCREAPAGFLNAFVHVSQKIPYPCESSLALLLPSRRGLAGYAFASIFATAKTAKARQISHGCHAKAVTILIKSMSYSSFGLTFR